MNHQPRAELCTYKYEYVFSLLQHRKHTNDCWFREGMFPAPYTVSVTGIAPQLVTFFSSCLFPNHNHYYNIVSYLFKLDLLLHSDIKRVIWCFIYICSFIVCVLGCRAGDL